MNSRLLLAVLSIIVVLWGGTRQCEAQSVEELVGKGIDAFQRSDYFVAIEYLETAVKLNPALPSGTVSLLASAYEHVGADDKAIAVYERIVENGFDRVHVSLIQLYLKHGRADDARRVIAMGINRPAASVPDLKRLASFLSEAGKINQRETDDSLLVHAYKRILFSDQRDVPTYVGFAGILIKQRNFSVFGSLIRLFHSSLPGNPQIDLMLGRAMLEFGKYDSAQSIAAGLLQIDPKSPGGLLLYGQSVLGRGLTSEAMDYFNRALIVDPRSADAYVGIATVHTAHHDTLDAIAAWEKALTINPKLDQAAFVAVCVGWGERLFKEGNLPSAIVFFSKVDSLQTARPEDDLTISEAEHKKGNFGSAKDHATRALGRFGRWIEDHPADLPGYLALCECHLLLGEFLSAENDLQRYINRIGPNNAGPAKQRLQSLIDSGIDVDDVRMLVTKYFPQTDETDETPGMVAGGSGATDTTRPLIVIQNSLRTRGMRLVEEYTDSLGVSGYAADSSGIMAVYVNGAMATLEDAPPADLEKVGLRGRGVKFEAMARLISGDDEIEVRAVDNVNNMSTKSIQTESGGGAPGVMNPLLDRVPKLWAVVVGVSRYQRKEMRLEFADRDALLFYGFLKGSCGGRVSDDHVDLLLNWSATRARILQSVHTIMGRAAENDMVIVYLACHGIPDDVGSDVYFMGSDGDPSNVVGTGISQTDIYRGIENARVRKVVLIADACHSGSLGMGPAGITRRGNGVDLTHKLMKEIADAHPGVAYFLASSASEFSEEGKRWGGGHGAFTYYLVNGLFGAADANQNGIVTIRELNDYVYRHVADDSRGSQHPILQGHFDNNLPLSVVK